eukprot:4160399-Pyramimonas_sp.AAC.1
MHLVPGGLECRRRARAWTRGWAPPSRSGSGSPKRERLDNASSGQLRAFLCQRPEKVSGDWLG